MEFVQRVRQHMKRTQPRPEAIDEGRDPRIIERFRWLVETALRYHRADVRGAENLPDGPALLVANHSGGLYTPEAYVIYGWWLRTQGLERPLFMLGHDLLFAVPYFGRLLTAAGGIPANPRNALRALERGSVLVFPGGDREAFRPFWHRDRVDFNGRRGFIRLAIKAGVPLVPLVSHGSHDTTFVLARGERIATWLRLNRVRSEIFPIVLGLPWGIAPGFIPAFSWPTRITVQLLPPFNWSHLGPEDADDEATVSSCYQEVTEAMQATLGELIAERPVPLFA